jgi:predicted enzyme related to lactoylglutathione lyase
MAQGNPVQVLVYSVKDIEAAKKVFNTFLAAEPYADSPYYVGYRVGEVEIGLDPNALAQGFAAPIAYIDTDDIQASIKALVATGAQLVQDATEVAPGLKVARLKDADGNYLGLRQGYSQ